MWNVNVEQLAQRVGYKESFILTMWNVNKILTEALIDKDLGFILTMWNVNTVEKEDEIAISSVLS